MSQPSSEAGAIDRAVHALHWLEDAFLALLLGAMVLLAPLQIFLRVFFDQGLTWADPLIRVLVLWVGLVGAISASRGDRHIAIDVLARALSGRPRAAVGFFVHLFTTGVCAVLAWHSFRFVQSEREYGTPAFLEIPAWVLEVVLPFAFAMIAVRYLLNAVREGAVVMGLRAAGPGPGERPQQGAEHGPERGAE